MKKKNNENQNKCIATDGCCQNQIARAFSFNSRYIQVDFIIGQSFSLFRFHSLRSLPFNFPLIYCWCIIFFSYLLSLALFWWRLLGLSVFVYAIRNHLFLDSKHFTQKTHGTISSKCKHVHNAGIEREDMIFFSVMNWIDRLQSRRREGKIYREEFLFNWTSEQCSKRQQ